MFCEGCFVRCLRFTSQRISNSILARLGIVLENRERWNKNTGEEKARSRKGGQFRFHSDFFQKSDEISGQRKFTGLRGVNLRKLEGGGEGRGGKGSERVAFEKLIRRSDDWCFESGASDNFNRFSILFRFQTHPEPFSLDIRDKFRPPFFLHFSWPTFVRITKEDDFSKTDEASNARLTPLYSGGGFEFTGLSGWKSSYERSSWARAHLGFFTDDIQLWSFPEGYPTVAIKEKLFIVNVARFSVSGGERRRRRRNEELGRRHPLPLRHCESVRNPFVRVSITR